MRMMFVVFIDVFCTLYTSVTDHAYAVNFSELFIRGVLTEANGKNRFLFKVRILPGKYKKYCNFYCSPEWLLA